MSRITLKTGFLNLLYAQTTSRKLWRLDSHFGRLMTDK